MAWRGITWYRQRIAKKKASNAEDISFNDTTPTENALSAETEPPEALSLDNVLEGQTVSATQEKSLVDEDSSLESKNKKRKHFALPIRVLMGFLPDVSEKDARDYALGVAERHFDQPAIAFFDAFKYEEGYAYEVHEGGVGLAYLPEILAYFKTLGPFEAGEEHRITILTGSRKVQVQRTRSGISAILLPESATQLETDWLTPSQKMSPALNQRTGLLIAGAVFFVTGFFAVLLASSITRIQPIIEAPPPAIERIVSERLPIHQWPLLANITPNMYVSKLVYENGVWQRPELRSVDAEHSPEQVNPEPSTTTP